MKMKGTRCSSLIILVGLVMTHTEMKSAGAFVQKYCARDVFTMRAASENPIDDIFYESSTTNQAKQWGIGDDWSKLSADSADLPKITYSSDYDIMSEAAQIMQDQEEQFSQQWETASDGGDNISSTNDENAKAIKHPPDDFVENAVDMIAGNMDYNEPGGVQLYDTISSTNSQSKRDLKRKIEEDELSFMIRCNQTPEQLLIEKGKALPELTDEMKYSVEYLLEKVSMDQHLPLKLQPMMTKFFQRSVKKMFDTHSIKEVDTDTMILDREALSKWMSTCITSPLQNSSKHKIGAHDNSISILLSRYSKTYGSGRLTYDEFNDLYLEVAWSGYVRDVRENKANYLSNDVSYKIPSADEGVLIHGKQNTEHLLKEASIDLIWRDLEAYGCFSPAEEERIKLLKEITYSSSFTTNNSDLLMDECELFEEYEDRLARQTYSDDNENDMLGVERDWGLVEKKEKGSHKLVEMTTNGQVPKRIRDGQFCFIDEESCIGCTQCATIAPSTFKMIPDTGRARAFYQSASEDVNAAVLSCPVHCMHYVSFDELKELEIARDDGDGRTDHRHFGRGKQHKPLHVSRRDSDANHKSSWYHYLKSKCAGTSCPQRGCYDCPKYSRPGENPFFIERHMHYEHIRARDFIASGEADKWRKVEEL